MKQYMSHDGGVRRIVSRVALAALMAVAGCHSHVRLNSPGPTAAQQERIAAFERLHSEGRMDAVLLQGDREVARSARFLMLANGRRVYYPEDLIPAVGEQSPSGQAAAASRSSRRKRWAWYTASVIGLVAGSALMWAGLPKAGDLNDPNDGAGDDSLLLWGTGVTAVSVVGGIVGFMYYGREESDTRAAAFMTYDESLRKQLRLCVDGQRLVDCDQAGASEPEATSPLR